MPMKGPVRGVNVDTSLDFSHTCLSLPLFLFRSSHRTVILSGCDFIAVPSRLQPLSEPSIRIAGVKVRQPFKLCHPERSVPRFPATRHSPAATCAAFSKESRMKSANATNLNRKFGKPRDLLCALTSNKGRCK